MDWDDMDNGGDVETDLVRGREACRREAWDEAYELLVRADAGSPLPAGDLERLAEAADMVGRCDDTVRLLRRAYQEYAGSGAVGPALRCAYWLCKTLAWGGEFAQSGVWLTRARRLADASEDCPESAYLLLLDAELLFRAGEYAECLAVARRMGPMADAGEDPDLMACAAMTLGIGLVKSGEIGTGLAQLDEAMTAVAGGEPSARATAMVYCVVIGVCEEYQEVRRAREWSDALADWCAAQPDFTGAYRGLCRVHRVAILRQGGEWPDAVREARLACDQLTGGYGTAVAGGAHYQLGEVHRLRGEFADAEQAYQDALRYGWDPQPGTALLRLAQGRRDTAVAVIRRALAETSGTTATPGPGGTAGVGEPMSRVRLLPAAVEILTGTETAAVPDDDDLADAARAAAELAAIAEAYPDTTALQAMSGHATGAVRLAQGAAGEALPPLRRAVRLWHELDLPYESARTRVLIARACRTLGDEDSAAMELDAARRTFARLGAAPDLAHASYAPGGRDGDCGLSPRELEVVRLLAAGGTNHAIAAELVLSERTVARHVSNIFGKLKVGSRTAVAAYAFEHGLVRRDRP
ncbi:LuxR C-terminal-related transcriptional regulator [Streptomyces sp. NPDC087263]|uniref:LuxR C-terminal-related transcriptional regulator n=1 Tax=Streptomyces sp. NPDC087263 TaxID=3365773 RepID=UPI00381B770C